MDEEEEDYMSEAILDQCTKNHVRPSLLHSQQLKHELVIYKKKQETHIPSFATSAEERRAEGLQTALSEDNKGFRMMQKMGYQVGSGIGKHETGIPAPIHIELKTDHHGLGHNSALREKFERPPSVTTDEYRKSLAERREMIDVKSDYLRSKRACRIFDIEDNLRKPIIYWFWPDEPASNEETSDGSEPEMPTFQEIKQRLNVIIMYLRDKYNYCLWCGRQFDNERDLLKDCPGQTRKSHDEDKAEASATGVDAE